MAFLFMMVDNKKTNTNVAGIANGKPNLVIGESNKICLSTNHGGSRQDITARPNTPAIYK